MGALAAFAAAAAASVGFNQRPVLWQFIALGLTAVLAGVYGYLQDQAGQPRGQKKSANVHHPTLLEDHLRRWAPTEAERRLAAALVGIHDLGKFHPSFQRLGPGGGRHTTAPG